ncbi:MAG: hypothetical protein V4478_02895 [Patescibacteria group bacterium]
MNTQTFAQAITKTIYETWKTKYAFWKYGIKVFYAPVIENPKLMIISYQPGGGEADFEKEDREQFEKGEFAPTFNTYIDTNYTMAKKVRSFFDFDPQHALLKESVIFPLIFFRTPSANIWDKELSVNKRTEMEAYSFSKTKEIVDTVKAEKILVIGLKAYKKLKTILGNIENEQVVYARRNGSEDMAITAEYKGTPIFAVIHFSGAKINRQDWATLKELFKNWI